VASVVQNGILNVWNIIFMDHERHMNVTNMETYPQKLIGIVFE
jgi:alanyl-tRNA synthetase